MKKKLSISLFVLSLVFFLSYAFFPVFRESVLKIFFTSEANLLYERSSLPRLMGDHLLMVFLSGASASVIGILLGLFVTRPSGRVYYPLLRSLASMAQTFPPSAVLALAVPIAGFGFKPVVFALFVYSIFPVINNTISGIEGVHPDLTEASLGMGMTPLQVLFKTEIPLAGKVIIAGIRTSTVINIGTATIGAVTGAGGLGRILMAGIIHNNLAYIFTGAFISAMLALYTDKVFSLIEEKYF